jgi:type IV pilus assembly protein PilM
VFGRGKSLMGLDIGSSSVKAIELKPTRTGFRVSAIDVEPLPPHTIVDGGIVDNGAVSVALARLLGRGAFQAKDVALSLSGHSVIVKKITLPAMTRQELADSIYWEAEQYIPFPLHDVNLDYEIIEDGAGINGKGSMDVLLVAAKKETIANYTTVVSQCGRRTAVVDVDAFAIQNAYEVNYGFERGTVVALLNIGAGATNVNILAGSQSVFTRDISMGGQAFTEALQRELEVGYEAAEQVKRGRDVPGAKYDEAKPVLRAVTENLLVELEKTFDFYKSTAATERIDRVMVSGGGSRIEGLADALEERFQTKIERFDPFRQVQFDRARLGQADPDELAPIAAVAVGLALRRAGDR